ncbi:MAG: glycoside hydrolase family 11 protein [Chitinispirillaceae bacterium]|nr:glycoside hydrolase family 11 protein [Chitinispirillaceae bacterium]
MLLLMEVAIAQTLTSNRTGTQGEFHYEYWKDSGNGTMILGEGGNFSCEWDAHNILFRKGVRPGGRDVDVRYSADYKPNGNSYLSVYGWTKNPLVEYYIVDSWGSWRPPGSQSKGTVESDGGTYDIYETTRTNQPSIEGTKTFQQYWSVRKQKKESGIISCGNHFNAWEKLGMKLGSFYEVSFNVEGWQSKGSADVEMEMGKFEEDVAVNNTLNAAQNHKINGRGHFQVTANSIPQINFTVPVKSSVSFKVYNFLGREVAKIAGKEFSSGEHSLQVTNVNLAHGVYYYTMKTGMER